jgi:hypothetical protein
MARYTKVSGFSDRLTQERITVRLHALKEVQETMSKKCQTELKNDYNVQYFRLAKVETKIDDKWLCSWPEDLTRDTREIKNLKATFRAVFSALIEKCARNFRPHRFSATLRKSEPFWVGWNNEWRDAQRPGQSRGPGFKMEEELERIFKNMESHLSQVFDEMMSAEMEAIVQRTATPKISDSSEDFKFQVVQGKLAMDFYWHGKIRRDILCRFEAEEKNDAMESELGADDAVAAQLANEANQPRDNWARPFEKEVELYRIVLRELINEANLPRQRGIRLSEKEVEVYETIFRERIAALETSKHRLQDEPSPTFPENEEGELNWVREFKRKLQTKYRRILKDLTGLIGDAFFEIPDHSTFWAFVKNWSDIFEDTRRVYTPGPLERVENIKHLQRKLRKLDRHMSTFLKSYYNEAFTRNFRDRCSAELEKKELPDNTMWFQVRLRETFDEDKQESFGEDKHDKHELHTARHLPKVPEDSMVWDTRWKDIVKNYDNPDYDFDPEDDGDMEPVDLDEPPHVFNGICTIMRDGKMKHQTLIEEEEPKEDEIIDIDADGDAPQAVVPEGGKRKRGRPRKEEGAAKRRRLSNSGRDEALLDESPRGRAPQRSDDAREMAYQPRRQRTSSASSVLTQLLDEVVEALNPDNDNDAPIVSDSGGATSSTQASKSNEAKNNAAGSSRKRQNAGTNGFRGDSDDERERKRRKKTELPADKVADDEDQPDPKDKEKGKEVDPIVPVKKKRGRPPGVKNKPKIKIPTPPNPVLNGNSNIVTPKDLNRVGPTPPGYQPPPNPRLGPNDITDDTLLTPSNRQLNLSSVRMDRPLPSGVNIPEHPQYLTPGPLPPSLNPPGAIFANLEQVLQLPQRRAELERQRQEEQQQKQRQRQQQKQQQRQQRQQQSQQQPGNQPLQAPQQPCSRTSSPSHAGYNSSVPPHTGTPQNPIVIDEQQPSSQRPSTNSPHPGAPNPALADRSQAGLPRIVPPQSSARQQIQQQQHQQQQQQYMHSNLAPHMLAAPQQQHMHMSTLLYQQHMHLAPNMSAPQQQHMPMSALPYQQHMQPAPHISATQYQQHMHPTPHMSRPPYQQHMMHLNRAPHMSATQQQSGIQQPTPPMSRNTSRDYFHIPPAEITGERRTYADALLETMPRNLQDRYRNNIG